MRVGRKPVVPKRAMGLRDGPDALDGAHVVEEHAAAAIDLHVDEARREQALDRAALDARRRDRSPATRRDAAVLDDDRAAVAHARRRRPGAGERNASSRVSVTLLRWGGWSGLRPRRQRRASASG